MSSGGAGAGAASAAVVLDYDQQRVASEAYLKAKQIPALLSHLLELIVYAAHPKSDGRTEPPADPRAFFLDAVKKLQAKQPDCLFGDNELKTMFEMIDVTKQGFIAVAQLRNAYSNLGGTDMPESALSADVRASGRVDLNTFKQVIGERLRTHPVW